MYLGKVTEIEDDQILRPTIFIKCLNLPIEF